MKISSPTLVAESTYRYFRQPGGFFFQSEAYNTTTKVLAADFIYGIPFINSRVRKLSVMALEVTVGHASKIRLGVYTPGGFQTPINLLLDAGEIDCTVAGSKQISGLNTYLGERRLYWLMMWAQGTPTVRALSSYWCASHLRIDVPTSGHPSGIYRNQAYGSWPATFGEFDFTAGNIDVPRLGVLLDSG